VKKKNKNSGNRTYIGVAGGSRCNQGTYQVAEEVGRKIAENAAILVCGARGGVMEAAAKGAKSAGGVTLGILPGLNKEEANVYIDYVFPTGLGQARNIIVVLSSDVLIAVGGEFGTLSEIALALKYGIPVVSLESWPLDKIEFAEGAPFYSAETPEEAVLKALEIAKNNINITQIKE